MKFLNWLKRGPKIENFRGRFQRECGLDFFGEAFS
jgi:hypothetical protein